MNGTTAAPQQHSSSGSGDPAAEQQHSGGTAAQQQAYLVSEAAALLELSERTLRAWVRQGKVPVLAPLDGLRGVRISAQTLAELKRLKPTAWDGERFLRQSGGTAAAEQRHTGTAAAEPQQDSGTAAAERHSSGTAATAPDLPALPAVRFYEELLDGLERERDQARDEADYLRGQLDRRAEEAARHAEAERELRVLLLQLERTNADLAAALVMKALPPHREAPAETPRRVRWWWPWTR